MSQALYRKWRPARFDQVIGQEHVTRTLQNAVAADRIGHAYLFSGPRGTGKTTLARLLAKAANCLDENLAQRPCDQCGPCIAVNEGRYLDLIEIDAASNTGVDDIRDLREKINFSPSEGRFKVYIIDEVHMLSTAAFNALLKTLEEPPPHAMFVLATTEEHKVPLTIKSRCQQFNFRLLTTQEIIGRIKWLAEKESLSIEPQAVSMIARHGAGSLRDAESLLDQLVAAPGDTITLDRAQTVLGTASMDTVSALTDAWIAGDGAVGLRVIHEALSSGADARQFARQMVMYLRQLLLLQMVGRELALDLAPKQKEIMGQQALKSNRQQLIAALKRFNEAVSTSPESWQPQLPLELAFIELLPDRSKQPSQEPLPPAPYPVELDSTAEKLVAEEELALIESPASSAFISEVVSPEQEPGRSPLEVDDTEVLQQPVDMKMEKEEHPASSTALSLAWVTSNWPKLRDGVGRYDKSLPALLASCKPLAVERNVLILGFDYPLLKEKFDRKPDASGTVAEVLSEMLGTKCTIQTVIASGYERSTATSGIDKAEFSALAEELGGVVHED